MNGSYARGAVVALALASAPGCAVSYFDRETGVEHLWGIGHMAMKVQPAERGCRAIATGRDAAGVSLDIGDGEVGAAAGYASRRRLYVFDVDEGLRIAWPAGGFFHVRVGGGPPLDHPGYDSPKEKK